MDLPFDLWWHTLNDEQRRQYGWGTGQAVWGWFPPALNARMAAQRAAFLIDAAPTLTDGQLEAVNEALDEEWAFDEVANATSVVGVPTYAGRKTRGNEQQMAPIFTIRIAADAKPVIRSYLESQNLTHRVLYPDMDGLRRELTGSYGVNGRKPLQGSD